MPCCAETKALKQVFDTGCTVISARPVRFICGAAWREILTFPWHFSTKPTQHLALGGRVTTQTEGSMFQAAGLAENE
jgi:hypothetical protein